MGLAFVPLYVRYLGLEAYGLIGVFAVMQAWLTILDVGMTPTLNREMARYTAGAHSGRSIRDLLRSVEILCFSVAVFIGVSGWAAAEYLASDWLRVNELPTEDVGQALSLMAAVVSLRLVESIYHGSLIGLRRQLLYNGISAIIAAVRHGGAAAILVWLVPTIQAFFLWQVFSSALSVAVLATCVQCALPKLSSPPKFSVVALTRVWKFAGGMMGITLFAILLTQVDKVMLSRMLSLDAFGIYTLAVTVASALYMVIVPIVQAVYPRMVELSSQDNQAALIRVYHQAAQLVTILTAPAVALLGFFAGGVVFVWSGSASLAERTGPILSVLAIGTFLNGLMYLPGQLQLAFGWTGLGLRTNMTAVAILIPAILWIVPKYGAVGAASVWVALNAGYVLISIQFMHKRLIPNEKWKWYFGDIILPVSGALAVTLLANEFKPIGYQSRWDWFVFLLMSAGLALAASTALAAEIRTNAIRSLRRVNRRGYS